MKKAIWVIPVILVIVVIVVTLICFRLNKENDSSNNDSPINETLDDKSKNLNGNNIVQSNNVMRDILDNYATNAISSINQMKDTLMEIQDNEINNTTATDTSSDVSNQIEVTNKDTSVPSTKSQTPNYDTTSETNNKVPSNSTKNSTSNSSKNSTSTSSKGSTSNSSKNSTSSSNKDSTSNSSKAPTKPQPIDAILYNEVPGTIGDYFD